MRPPQRKSEANQHGVDVMKPHPDTAFGDHATDRLVIRRFRDEDAATLAVYRSDPAVA